MRTPRNHARLAVATTDFEGTAALLLCRVGADGRALGLTGTTASPTLHFLMRLLQGARLACLEQQTQAAGMSR